MLGLNGYSLQTTHTLLSWVGGMYRDQVQGPKSCVWTTKTLRLSSSLCDHEGVGFTELVAVTSPGYAFAEQSSASLFSFAYEGEAVAPPNDDPYLYTNEHLFFPVAESFWEGILQICMFGEGNVELSGDPDQLIFGFTIGGEAEEPYIVGPGHQLGFLAGDIKILLQTPYHFNP